MPKHPCIRVIREAAGNTITEKQAKELIDGITDRANKADNVRFANLEERIRAIGGDILNENDVARAIQRRNALLTVKSTRQIMQHAQKFSTLGEGLEAYMNGSRKVIPGARMSVDAQVVALRNKYIGKLVAELDRMDLIKQFRSGVMDEDIFTELWHIRDPDVSNPTGNRDAMRIAQAIDSVHQEMIPRENRAGAFIRMMDNYVMRQTHDPIKIRRAGGMGFGRGSADASFKAWSEFILPLLDPEKTFGSATDRVRFLKGVHEGILSGTHGKSRAKMMAEFKGTGALAKKVSQPRVLHFKDAQSAYKYNQVFGTKTLYDGVLSDIRKSSHVTALMENFGPNPDQTFSRTLRMLKEQARTMPDDFRQTKSLNREFIQSSYNGLKGELDIPNNPTLHGMTRALLAHSTLSRLGQVTISAIPDKAFFHSTMTYNGMRSLDVFLEQFKVFVPKTKADRVRLRMMGAAIDGFLGDVASRFTSVDNTSGRMFRLQQQLFKINGMNWWNDIHKGSAAKLMTAWLGENANLRFDALPQDLSKVLSLYDVTPQQWDAIRTTAYDFDGRKYVTPDQLSKIPDEVIDRLLVAEGDKATSTNRLRYRDRMESQLRAYITDQVDDAVVTPGNRERVISNWGTQAGTLRGDAVRLLMHFKSFPISVWERIVRREVYGHGSMSLRSWLMNDRKGNFRLAQLLAMTTVGGYVSISIKDALKGRTPRRIVDEDGRPNLKVFQASFLRGGGAGIYGDFLFTEYDRSYRNALNVVSGPVIGQVPEVAAMVTDAVHGKDISRSAGKLALNNTPYINLFYIRPVLDYSILWNLQEMLDPGSLRRMERAVEERNHQGFFVSPSEVVNR